MSTSQKIMLAVVLLQGAYALYQKMVGNRNKREVDRALARPGPAPADAQTWLATVVARVASMRAEVVALRARAVAVAEQLRAAGEAGGALANAAQRQVIPGLGELNDQLDAVLALARAGDVEALAVHIEQRAGLGQVVRRLGGYRWMIDGLETQAQWRNDLIRKQILENADIVAAALLAPIVRFAEVQGLRFPGGPPVVFVGAAPGFQVAGRTLVAMPEVAGDELQRWSAMVPEMGRLILQTVPDFEAEVLNLMPNVGDPRLPVLQNRRLIFDGESVLAGWLPTLAADAVSMLLLGPAALRGLVHTLVPTGSREIEVVGVAADGHNVEPVPPSHLRVHLAAWFLERIGFVREPEALRREWARIHGAADRLQFSLLTGEVFTVPLARFAALGELVLEAFYTTPWASLAGYPITGVPGLEMSPGLWGRVRRRAADLAAGTAFNDDARVVVAAAVEAANAAPDAETRIVRAARRALTGHTQPRTAGPGAEASGQLTRADVHDALVLGILLGPRTRARRP